MIENLQYIFHQDPIKACLLVILMCTTIATVVCYILGFIGILLIGMFKTIEFFFGKKHVHTID